MRDRFVLGTDEDDLDEFDVEDPDVTDYSSRPVPGLPSLLLGLVDPKPYPINIYNFDNDSTSGIAGTLYPDGRFAVLHVTPAPQDTVYWDEVVARKVPGKVTWNGCVAGSIELHIDEPFKRTYDGSVTGDWPNHPPRPERVVNPEKARLAALENERERRGHEEK